MKTGIFFLSFLFPLLTGINAQHLIDFNKNRVHEIVKKEMKGFKLDDSSFNPVYNYLKFVNSSGTKTLLVFFDKNDISTKVRLVSDYTEFSSMNADFDARYKKTGKKGWEYKENNNTFSVTIEEQEWYFVVQTEKKKVSKWWF